MQLLRGIDWVMVACGTVISGACEDDTGCDDDCRTYILLIVIYFV